MSLDLEEMTLERFIEKNKEYLEDSYIFSVSDNEICFSDWCELIYQHRKY